MRQIIVTLSFTLIVFCSLYIAEEINYADIHLFVKQKFIFDILQHYHQDNIQHDEYKDYVIQDNYNQYDQPDQVRKFVSYYQHNNLPLDEVFSIFNEHHEHLAHGVADTLYGAKDFDTFVKTAVWAKNHMNRNLFLYSFLAAIIGRSDMQKVVFPAIYEINPYYFFTAETIQKAQQYKMQEFQGFKKIEDVYTVVIPSNYTGVYGHINKDNILSYFREDVGLNAFYYYWNQDYSNCAIGRGEALSKYIPYRGQFYLYHHWQLLARYYMERLSHNLGKIEEFNWYTYTNHPGYHSGLQYYNGFDFPSRDNNYNFYNRRNYLLIDNVQYYEGRILESIDLRRWIKEDLTYEKFAPDILKNIEILGNIIQGNKDSYNKKYYGSIDKEMRNIFNEAITHGKYGNDLPGVLLHYETSIKDPVFYEMYKHLLKCYFHYLDSLPPYTDEELGSDVFFIETVEVDKLVTYYDEFDSDISNVVDVELNNEANGVSDLVKFRRISHYQGKDYVIKARQYRLNHLPFSVKITVNSKKRQVGMVKFFLAPKYDHYGHKIHLWNNRENFFELEHFIVDLNAGKNVITRNSKEFTWYTVDETTYFELYKKVMTVANSRSYKLLSNISEVSCGIPNRLMLPRGKKGGMEFQLFIHIRALPLMDTHIYENGKFVEVESVRYIDDTPFGYPFDRKIDAAYWNLTNMYFQEVTIYHETKDEVNERIP